MAFHVVDDVELLFDAEHRQVQYRSAPRVGQFDADTQRLRYNQFVRMLNKRNGGRGWETPAGTAGGVSGPLRELPRLRFLTSTPYRWTGLIVDKGIIGTQQLLDRALTAVDPGGAAASAAQGSIARAYSVVMDDAIQPLAAQLTEGASKVLEKYPIVGTTISSMQGQLLRFYAEALDMYAVAAEWGSVNVDK